MEPLGDEGVARRHVIGQHLGAAGHAHAAHRDEILERDGHAVERAAAPAGRLLGVGGAGAGPGSLAHHGDVGAQHAVVAGDAVEIGLGGLHRGDLAGGERLADAA